jgi:hypothetical protein
MPFNITISVLLLYPVLYLLPLNLVRFRWGFEQGLAPMPPEVQEKAKTADRIELSVKHAILLAVVVFLIHGSPISTHEVGLTTDNWKAALGVGILFSLFPLGLTKLRLRNMPPEKVLEESQSRGPVAAWCGLNTLASFSNEFWRAFCIVSLIRLDLSAWVAVPIVAVVYGTLNLQTSVARALGSATFGGVAGFLFVYTGSLLSPLTMVLIAAGAYLYQVRQAIHHPESRYSSPCPVCGAIIPRSEVHMAGDFLACPSCGESLTTQKKHLWVVGALSLVAAAYATRHLIYRDLGYLLVTEGLTVVLFIVGAILVGLFLPPNYTRVGGKTFDKSFSLFGTDKSDADKRSPPK